MTPKRSNHWQLLPIVVALCATTAGLVTAPAHASSHREAPFITTVPKVDATEIGRAHV